MDELYREKLNENLEQVQAITKQLGRFDIIPWQWGSEFYVKEHALQWANIMGILFTALLLSFGAPFWFDRLKDVLNLIDRLSKGVKAEEKKGNQKKQDN